ncbi:MAG: glycosyltransferase [SAR324 cluster bacterium]|nr:glycosyltransferase [SAR324 cluster bacterium]
MQKHLILLADNLAAGAAALASDFIDGYKDDPKDFGSLYIIHSNNLAINDFTSSKIIFIECLRTGNFLKDHSKRTKAVSSICQQTHEKFILVNLTNFPVKLESQNIEQRLLLHNLYLLGSPKSLSKTLTWKSKLTQRVKKLWFGVTMNLYKEVTLYLTQTRLMENQLLAAHPQAQGKAEIVLPYFSKHLKQVLENSQKEPKQKFWIYPAAFHPHKNHWFLIKLAEYLKKNSQKELFFLTLDIKSPELQLFLHAIKSKGLHDYFYFTGWLQKNEVLKLLDASKGLIFPSTFEALGLPLIEAQLLGKKIIAADTPGNRDVTGQEAHYFKINSDQEFAPIAEELKFGGEVKYKIKAVDSALASLLGPYQVR